MLQDVPLQVVPVAVAVVEICKDVYTYYAATSAARCATTGGGGGGARDLVVEVVVMLKIHTHV